MIDILKKVFFKQSEVSKAKEFYQYTVICSLLSVILNIILFGLKLFCSSIVDSVAIAADGYSNLLDAGAMLISIYALWVAHFGPGENHPFGHGRLEWLAGLLNANLLFALGINICFDSINCLIHPKPIKYSFIVVAMLFASLLVKGCMFLCNASYGRKNNSEILQSAAIDCISDMLLTFGVLTSFVVTAMTGIVTDGWAGLLVACIIMASAYRTAQRIVNRIIGIDCSKDISSFIEHLINHSGCDIKVYDLMVHDYGFQNFVVSMHLVSSENKYEELSYWAYKINYELYIHFDAQSIIQIEVLASLANRIAITQTIDHIVLTQPTKKVCVRNLRVIQSGSDLTAFFDLIVPLTTGEFADIIQRQITDALPEIQVICFKKLEYKQTNIYK